MNGLGRGRGRVRGVDMPGSNAPNIHRSSPATLSTIQDNLELLNSITAQTKDQFGKTAAEVVCFTPKNHRLRNEVKGKTKTVIGNPVEVDRLNENWFTGYVNPASVAARPANQAQCKRKVQMSEMRQVHLYKYESNADKIKDTKIPSEDVNVPVIQPAIEERAEIPLKVNDEPLCQNVEMEVPVPAAVEGAKMEAAAPATMEGASASVVTKAYSGDMYVVEVHGTRSEAVEVNGQTCPPAEERVKPFLGGPSKVQLLKTLAQNEVILIQEKDGSLPVLKENSKHYEEFQYEMTKAEHELIGKKNIIKAEVKKCYALQLTVSREWCRVRLLKFYIFNKDGDYGETGIGLVYFLDQGFTQYAPLSALRQLPDRFTSGIVPIFRCYLHGLRPTDCKGQSCLIWTKEAVEYFHKILQDADQRNELLAIPLKWKTADVNKVLDDLLYDLGVSLLVNSSEKGLVALNFQLIEMGYAEAYLDSTE